MQNTDTSRPSRVKVTRIQNSCFHTCIRQPAAGVAETSSAEEDPRLRTTRPPETLYAFTSWFAAPCRYVCAVAGGAEDLAGEGAADPGPEGDGVAEGDAGGVGDGAGGSALCVEEDSGCVVSGTASGGSYAVPDITVCTPHHDSVTAAPVARVHAPACASPLRIGGHTAPPVSELARPPWVSPEWATVRAMASVLVVEDDQFVRSALIRHLTEASHTVRSVGTALEALREVAHHRFDLVILDLGLPDLDGAEALKMLRGITDVPVIIATARDDEAEIVRLLNDGADDYLTKPFSVEHLSARMAAVLRRARSAAGAEPPSRVLRVGGLAIDPLRRQAELDGAVLDLTRREFDLLAFLAGRPGVVVARRELLAEVWQQSYGDDQTIDVHLSWLRRKLGETAASPRYLHTLRGVGVKLEPPQ